jgi:hypothetical protein
MAKLEQSKDPSQVKSSGDEAAPGAPGPGKIGLTSGDQPDLVAPSGVNERDHGAADDKPMGGGSLNFDDDDMTHPRGKATEKGGTWQAQGADSGKLGRPAEIQSDRIGPSDPDRNVKQ